MYFILLVGVFAFYLTVDRFVALYIRARPMSKAFLTQIRAVLRTGDLEGAQTLARTSNSNVSDIVELAIKMKAEGVSDDELQSRIDESLTEKLSGIDRGTSYLAVIGNIATLVGLLGTISGMITSFSAVSGATATERATLLSMGISEAMNCTAFGLLVAIPALLGYAFFQSKTDRIVASTTESVSKLYHDLIYLYEPQSKKA